ncbi:Periplasmic component of the Tol biopolymer transport system [Gilliamella apis SCGC AB-598-P17]|nr:Periplasmic component of the Tol biopolymer transport system [Gilliamella apis SCGC AB-598-P17]
MVKNNKGPYTHELRVSDYDGYDQITVHRSKEPLMSPTWSPDGKKLAYVTFESGRSALVLKTLDSGAVETIASFPQHNGAPAFSPDGSKLAFALSKGGSLNLYMMNLSSKKMFDVYQIVICVVTIGLLLVWRGNHFLFITVSEELAFSHGIDVPITKFILTILLALTIGIAMKFIGALIITALLIIPAATAKYYAKNPESMAIIAILIGMISIIGGILFSLFYDTPTGPSVVLSNTCLFFISLFISKFFIRTKN